MFFFIFKIIIAATTISFCSWLSGKKPELAGFIIALPLGTMMTIVFSHMEYKDPEIVIQVVKSILVALPFSLLFFVPFIFYKKINVSFWGHFSIGIGLLFAGYLLHYLILKKTN